MQILVLNQISFPGSVVTVNRILRIYVHFALIIPHVVRIRYHWWPLPPQPSQRQIKQRPELLLHIQWTR